MDEASSSIELLENLSIPRGTPLFQKGFHSPEIQWKKQEKNRKKEKKKAPYSHHEC